MEMRLKHWYRMTRITLKARTIEKTYYSILSKSIFGSNPQNLHKQTPLTTKLTVSSSKYLNRIAENLCAETDNLLATMKFAHPF